MNRMATLAVVAALCWVPAPAAEEEREAERIQLPQTIEKLWFRAEGHRREGYLTITDEGLEFTARKRTFAIPLERIHFISYGTMGIDVDTEWILLTVGVTPPYDLVGLRDGTRWGFGGRTPEIFARLRAVLEQLSGAQYGVAPGQKVYEDPDQSCAFGIPEDWSVYVESLVVLSGRSPWGTTIFSERPIRSIETRSDGRVEAVDDLELLDAILAGESPGFFFERGRAGRGMSCRRISAKGRAELLERAVEDIVFGEHYEVLEPPEATPRPVAGCEGLRIVGRSRRADGAEVVLELVAATQGETLFLFGMRARAENLERYRQVFERSIATIRFPRRLDSPD